MIYGIDTVSSTTYKDSVITALTDAGQIETIYYNSGTQAVFKLLWTDKVFRINGAVLYAGDVWTSGTTVTNEIIIMQPYNTPSILHKGHVITGTDYFAIVTDQNNVSYLYSCVVTKDNEGVPFSLGFGSSVTPSFNRGWCYNLVTRERVAPLMRLNSVTRDDDDYLFSLDLYLTGLISGKMASMGFPSVKYISRFPDLTTLYTLYGDDAAVHGYSTNEASITTNLSLLLVGGRI